VSESRDRQFLGMVDAQMSIVAPDDVLPAVKPKSPRWLAKQEAEQEAIAAAEVRRHHFLNQASTALTASSLLGAAATLAVTERIRSRIPEGWQAEFFDGIAAGTLADYALANRAIHQHGQARLRQLANDNPFDAPPEPPKKRGLFGRG
jgi:hypothetical protein